MKIHTYQIAKWRKVRKLNIQDLDTTVKSGEPLLAPTWNMVLGYKTGTISDTEYELHCMTLLKERYNTHPDFFKWLTSREEIALGCYCKAGNFCHRYLIIDFLKTITEVDYRGEIV